MFHRKDAVSMAVVGLLASCGLAMAASTEVKTPALSLDPSVLTAQDAGAPSSPLMMGLDKIGLAKPIQSTGINIYGWVEAGYDVNLRNNASAGGTSHPGALTREIGNHVMLNQVAIRVEKLVDPKKWDVGGLVEANFGDDDNFTSPAVARDGTFSSGWEYQTPGDNPGEVPHIDITQAFVDVNAPVGNGLKVRVGRFYTLLGYESFDPRGNPFYTHSMLWGAEPLNNTGVVAFYSLNDQWAVAGGVTRGINQNTEDDNGSPDGIAQIAFTPSKQLTATLNLEVGPQDPADTSHWQTLINPVVAWQVTDKLKIGGEGLYIADGGINGAAFAGISHAYGDVYGVAGYAQYGINDYLIANARVEWFHSYLGASALGVSAPTTNQYELTLGVIIKPLPKDPIGQNLMIRPEVRYDFSEDHLYPIGNGSSVFRDQWTVGADVIFTF